MKFFEYLNHNGEIAFFGIVAVALILIVLTIASCDRHNTRLYTQNGYEQVQKQGSTETMWRKK